MRALPLLALFLMSAKHTDISGPRLRLAQKVLDIGDVPYGESKCDTMWFENVGNEPLVVQDVFTSCGCTVADYSHEPVAPDSTGYIAITFRSKGRAAAPFQKEIRIKSNARNFREIFYIKGNVVK